MRVLLLSTTVGYQLRSFSESADRLGIELLLATDRCHQLDDPWQDDAIPVRFHEEDASLAAIRDSAGERLDGVIAVGDRPVVLASRVAAAFGLPGNPRGAAECSSNKKLMRRSFASAGLPVPWVVELPHAAHLDAVLPDVHFPCVVKPLGLSASRGVIRAVLARPAVRAMRTGLEDELMIEGFIEGREFAVEGVLTGGRLLLLAIFDKPDPLDGPFFEETIYVTPSAASSELQDAIREATQRAAGALGLTHGPVHAECRVSYRGVFMLEVAARPIGGLCSKVLRFRDDGGTVPLEDVLLRHACGMDVSATEREAQAAGVMMIPIPARGLYKGVSGVDRAGEVPGIEDVRITAKPDQLLEPLPEGDSYLGFIFARAATPEAVTNALRSAHAHLRFDLAPPIRLAP